MLRRFLQPKWIAATVVVIIIASLFIVLGVWQLDRLNQRHTENAVGEEQLNEPPADFDDLLVQADGDLSAIEYRRAIARGAFDVEGEVLVRSQVYLGTAGFNLVTPLIMEDGSAVLVNRGWVPLNMDTVPVEGASPVPIAGTVNGWIELSQSRPPLGPKDPEGGRLVSVSRIDIDRIQQQLDYPLAPVYLVLENPITGELPVPLAAPRFDEDGPHLAYAIQWFGFAMVLLGGYFFFTRKQLRGSA